MNCDENNVWPTLYGKDSKGKIRAWVISTDSSGLIGMLHGLKDGKQTFKAVQAVGKNIGKVNETSDAQQAILEAQAKWVKQKKTGYFETVEEALAYEPFTPMKAQNYNDHADKIVYPCDQQPKLNGQRLMIDKNGDAWSKQGEPLELPSHWFGVREFAIEHGGLDGEIYAGLESEGGLSLQDIISAFRKPNANTPKLRYYVYDLPIKGIKSAVRQEKLRYIVNRLKVPAAIEILLSQEIANQQQGDDNYRLAVSLKYEGVIYRNYDGEYEFDKRSYNLIKRKPRADLEARVLSVEKDRNGDGILFCEILNGENTGNRFKCLMRKDSDNSINYRKYENALDLIGKIVTVEYEEFSDDGIITKPVGVGLRALSETGKFL